MTRTAASGNALPQVWNATPEERAERYPCDDLDVAYDDAFFRAIDVDAPRPLVYRWLCQLRVAPYSYDLLDNFARRSPVQLTPGLEDLRVGQRVMHLFEIASFEPNEHLTIVQSRTSPMRAIADFSGSYRLRGDGARVRLVAKVLARNPRGPLAGPIRAALPWVDFLMFRKQLLTLKAYCERDARLGR